MNELLVNVDVECGFDLIGLIVEVELHRMEVVEVTDRGHQFDFILRRTIPSDGQRHRILAVTRLLPNKKKQSL